MRTPTRETWYSMRKRCLNSNDRAYKWYGAKGIKIDPRWDSFKNFLADMGERPEGMTLDRIDSSKGYNARNCRWSNWRVQQSNRTNNNEVVGVGYHKASKLWRAYIRPNGKQISLGYYKTQEEAVVARKMAEKNMEWF